MTDIMARRALGFVLWRAAHTDPAPAVRVVRLVPGNPPSEVLVVQRPLRQNAEFSDLWELPLRELPLTAGTIYYYWFVVPDGEGQLVLATDPFARVIDYRLGTGVPAGVFKIESSWLVDCDPDGDVGAVATSQDVTVHAPNNQLVIYELPSSWTRGATEESVERDVGTFRDVLALWTPEEPGAHFADVPAVAGRAHLLELGVNALQLLPPADSPFNREWGYGTGNYCAADWDLGFPRGNASPTSEQDLRRLVWRLHELGVRFVADMVMAFGYTSYRTLNFSEFHIDPLAETHNPDAYQSSRSGELRDGFGGSLWRYGNVVEGYDPVSGELARFVPARRFHITHMLRWLREFGVDGLRLDSVNNVANWDFIREFSQAAREEYRSLYGGGAGIDARFLTVGEELSVPLDLVQSGTLEGMWNETFKRRLRAVLRGQALGDETFTETVLRMIDCRQVGFADGTQAVNYITSHDVEGFENERLFLFLQNNGVGLKLERFKLAFACLLVAVGIPMILAGEEFADEHDRPLSHPDKQQDPLNFSRVAEPWRRELFDYVARLVRFRIAAPALAMNDTQLIHTDTSDGRRIVAWVRGVPGREDPVVVVANFSGVTPPGQEYRVPGWPETPPGRSWREITQDRNVPSAWIGREPLFPWEAKVYTLA